MPETFNDYNNTEYRIHAAHAEQVEPLISLYQDGEASKSERQVVEQYLATCDYCRATLESYQRIEGRLKSFYAAIPAPRFNPQDFKFENMADDAKSGRMATAVTPIPTVLQGEADEPLRIKPARPRRSRAQAFITYGIGAAAVLLIFITGLVAFNGISSGTATPTVVGGVGTAGSGLSGATPRPSVTPTFEPTITPVQTTVELPATVTPLPTTEAVQTTASVALPTTAPVTTPDLPVTTVAVATQAPTRTPLPPPTQKTSAPPVPTSTPVPVATVTPTPAPATATPTALVATTAPNTTVAATPTPEVTLNVVSTTVTTSPLLSTTQTVVPSTPATPTVGNSTATVAATITSAATPVPGNVPTGLIAYVDRTDGQVHVVEADGKNNQALTSPAAAGGIAWEQLIWSPDGKQLLAVGLNTNRTERGIYLLDLGQSRRVELLTNGFAPSWSPDGASLAYLAGAGNIRNGIKYGQPAIFDLKKRAPQLISNQQDSYEPQWFADSKRVLLGQDRIYSLASGQTIDFNLPFINDCIAASLSPSGDRLAVLEAGNNGFDTVIYDFSDPTQKLDAKRTITRISTGAKGSIGLICGTQRLRWTADGQNVFHYSSFSGTFANCLATLATEKTRCLTNVYDPSFNSNGSYLADYSPSGGLVYVMASSLSGRPDNIKAIAETRTTPAWQPRP